MVHIQIDSNLKYLNLGCGYRSHPQWTNVNFVATGKKVIAHDLSKNIPFADNTFDLVYHSHVLEHFSQAVAVNFIEECYRVLRPGGIVRVVVPDLEQIARLYLKSLDRAADSAEWSANYEWIVLELLDQMVRNRRGGEMASYLSRSTASVSSLTTARYGAEAAQIKTLPPQDSVEIPLKKIKPAVKAFYQLLPQSLKRFYTALKIGYYRQGGEVHQWMYDRYSLSNLLEDCGLEKVVQRSASDSYLADWRNFNLDTEPDGSVYKPDSLFMEALKPTN